jgi:hypothetical protein
MLGCVRVAASSISVARPLAPATTEYSSVLVEEGPEADFRIVSAWGVLRKNLLANQILLPFVRRGSALHRGLVASKISARVQVWPTSYVSWVEHQDWESYCRVLKERFPSGVKTHAPSIKRAGQLNIRSDK